MKTCLTIVLILACVTVYSQSDTLTLQSDSLIKNADARLDSVQHGFTAKSDSIKQSYVREKQKLLSFRQRYALKLDSLKSKATLTPRNPLDTLAVSSDAVVYTRKIDSLDQKIQNVQQRTTMKIDSLKGVVSEQVNKFKLPKEAQGKVTELTAVMDKVSVPAFDTGLTDKFNLPAVHAGVPAFPDVKLPDTNLPNVNINIPGSDLNVPNLNTSIPSVNTEKISELTGRAGDLQKQVTEATGSMESLGKTLENKAGEQIKGLPDQKLPEVPGLEGGVPKTGDEAKEQLAQLAKKEAVNHFAGKEAVLTNAMEKMSKYKQKYSSVSSLSEIKDEKHHNELKGKPLLERLVPALTLQFQSWQDVMLDINPSVGYKITSHLTAGIGWNQRVAFNIPQSQFNAEAKVYGIRTYGEYTFKKGFGFRLDVETMNTPSKQKDPAIDPPPTRDWVWGALVGVKQKYPIYKKLKGNAQLMYNIFDKDHRSPYLDRVNFRIGLELSLKSKKKRDSWK